MISILTGRDDVTRLARLEPVDIATKWLSSLSVEVGENFRQLNKVEYWQCNVTGFHWYSPPEAAGGCELYVQLEEFGWYYMSDKWEFSVALDLLAPVSLILEVGVGEGRFLQAARKKEHVVQGVELNPMAAKRARSLGFRVHQLMLHELSELTADRFDAICSFQVLEHVPNPLEFIEGMIGLLRPGGKMIFSVPNAAVMRKIDPDNQDLLNQPPHHMGHWDEGVFRALENLLPLKVRSVHREPLASYHVSWILNGYLRGLLSPLGNTIPRLLVNRYSTIPLQWLLHAGLRNLLPGHTLLVEFEYWPD